jgi:hypothetical protein
MINLLQNVPVSDKLQIIKASIVGAENSFVRFTIDYGHGPRDISILRLPYYTSKSNAASGDMATVGILLEACEEGFVVRCSAIFFQCLKYLMFCQCA